MTTTRHHAAPVPVQHHQPSEVLSAEEAAHYLRIGEKAVRKLWQTGHLPGVSLNQKHLVFRLHTLDHFLARLESDPAAQQVIRNTHAGSDHEAAAPAPAPTAAAKRQPVVHTPVNAPRGRTRRTALPDLAQYEGAANA